MKYPDLGDLSILDFLRTYPNAGLYVGMTGQILEREDLRWLIERGHPMKASEVYVGRKTQKNRPSILKSDGETIKEKEAREEYGFKSLVVYESPIRTNVPRTSSTIVIVFPVPDRKKEIVRNIPLHFNSRGKCTTYQVDQLLPLQSLV